ncbi:MAG: hypothetical protein ACSHYA_13915 [Opitutaceae bacterium]
MNNIPLRFIYLFLTASCVQLSIHGANWTGNGNDNKWSNPSNWEGNQPPHSNNSPKEGEALINSTSPVELNSTQNIMSLRVGAQNNKSGELIIGLSASLDATRKNQTSRVGSSRGGHGKVRQNGGTTAYHILQVGLDQDSQGVYELSGGALTVTREAKGTSLLVGKRGTGAFSISGNGSFFTRAGVELGGEKGGIGTFEVVGPEFTIGVGSHGSMNGSWVQHSGSRLKASVAPAGVRHIQIDGTPEKGSLTKVVFEKGALLDLGFIGNPVDGQWLLMQWEGPCVNNGLQLAPSVDTSIWSFKIVETDGVGQLQIQSTL